MLPPCFLYPYFFTVYCSLRRTDAIVVISWTRKTLIRFKKVSVLENIIRHTEYTRKLTKGTKLVRNVSYFYNSPRKSGTNGHLPVHPGEKAPLGERLGKSRTRLREKQNV